MTHFESWKQYSEFSYFVMRSARHVRDAKNQRFLDTVVQTSAKRESVIEKGTVLWRAQLDHKVRTRKPLDGKRQEIDSFDARIPCSPKRMIPQPDRANEGRVNPKGIPCLYLSTDRDTAMAETRPWIGSYVTVARFSVIRDLTVVDCSAMETLDGWKLDLFFGAPEPEPDKREECVWGDINRAFSQPITRTDDVAEYVPTQVLAEAFRMSMFGYDGIVYGSKVGTGKSIAVFDLAAAKLASRHLFKVDAFSLKFSRVPKR